MKKAVLATILIFLTFIACADKTSQISESKDLPGKSTSESGAPRQGMTIGQAIYGNQLNYFAQKDLEGLVRNNYTEDAVLTMFDYQARGRDALRKHFRGFFEVAGDIKLKSTDRFVETKDTVLLEATLETTKLGQVRFIDAFVIRGDKIAYQFTIMK